VPPTEPPRTPNPSQTKERTCTVREPTSIAVLTGPKANPIKRKTKLSSSSSVIKLHHRRPATRAQQPRERPSPSRLPAIAHPHVPPRCCKPSRRAYPLSYRRIPSP
jgi:hypothetical protein